MGYPGATSPGRIDCPGSLRRLESINRRRISSNVERWRAGDPSRCRQLPPRFWQNARNSTGAPSPQCEILDSQKGLHITPFQTHFQNSSRILTSPMIKLMTLRSLVAVLLLIGFNTPTVLLAENPLPVRMGCGIMTFDTVPGWGLRPDGNSSLGPTHGAVVVDKEGHIYVSANAGIFVFSPEGKVVQSYLGDDYTNLHDMEIREEGDQEFIYGARNQNGEGIKLNAHSGEVVLRLPFPEESGLKLKRLVPTAITVTPDGDIFLSDGYGSNHIFKFDKHGKYLMHFGEKGNAMEQFNTAHGMTLDTRYDPPRLLICDRNHQPKGRLVHYDLEGKFIDEVVTGLGNPTSVAIQGDYVSVPDLHGRVVILDKSNTIIAVLGHNADPGQARNFGVPQEQWIEGLFTAAHGSSWDAEGNLYVQDWNVAGRIHKLVKVK